jgi:N4-gp56 family major capsid protein
MAVSTTTTSSGLVVQAYDKYIEFALRSEPLWRNLVDKRPVDVTSAGHSVILKKYANLAAATGDLTEATDPGATTFPATSDVTVTLTEKGAVVTRTEQLSVESLSDIDPAIADIVAYQMRDSLDQLVRDVYKGGTNRITSNAGAPDASAVATNTLTASDVFKSALGRYATTKLRGASAVPTRDGLYSAYIHPDVSYDFRADTGNGGWRLPHEYSSPGNIWAGEIGVYEGAFYVETPRTYSATDGAASAVVHRTIVCGKQAVVEAVSIEPHVVIGPIVDPLMRYRHVGWKGLLGWAVYRQEALRVIESGVSIT